MSQFDQQSNEMRSMLTPEKMYSLDQIIKMTGHRSENAAYVLLRRKGKEPDGFRTATHRPRAVWRESVVREVFALHLERARRIRRWS